MKLVFAAAPLVAAFAFAVPDFAQAQEPNRSPAAAPMTQQATEQAAPADRAVPRDVAVPRASAPAPSPRDESSRGERTRRESTRGDAARANAGEASTAQERRGAVRRPPSDSGRSGQAPRDRAVARTSPPPRDWDRDRGRDRDRVYYYPSYWSYGRYYDPYYSGGLHLGYLAYSPWGWTPSFYGYPYGYGGGYGGGYAARGYGFGALRTKVNQRDAEVYVDGYFAGHVDDFDGIFQSLKLESGGYKVEIRKTGYEPLTFDVHIQPDRKITYRGEMRPTP